MEKEIQFFSRRVLFHSVFSAGKKKSNESELGQLDHYFRKITDQRGFRFMKTLHKIFLRIKTVRENNYYFTDTFFDIDNFEATVILHHLFPQIQFGYELESAKNKKLFIWLVEKNLFETTLYDLLMNRKLNFACMWIEMKELHPICIRNTIDRIRIICRKPQTLNYVDKIEEYYLNTSES